MEYEKEYWIYQRRSVEEPWAFKIVKHVDTDRSPVMAFDMVLYHVRAPACGTGCYGEKPKNLSGFSDMAFRLCLECGIAFDDIDAMQIDSAMLSIIEDASHYSDYSERI